jgi:transcriptional regulator with XRE-family HTH domain
MNINIGENIKNLRKRKEITQEELAEYLGISFQSISKWERGDGFPDITMLPDIADFFNISIDDLIGAERTVFDGGYFYDTLKQAKEYESSENYDEAIKLLREISMKYPNHYELTSKLASLLLLKDSESKEGKLLARKAITLCERILNGFVSEKGRSTARATLCFLYENIGDHQKAIDLARNLPHFWEGREILWGELMEGQEYIDYLKRFIFSALSVINLKIDSVFDNSKKINVVDMLTISPSCDDVINAENRYEIAKKIVDFLD